MPQPLNRGEHVATPALARNATAVASSRDPNARTLWLLCTATFLIFFQAFMVAPLITPRRRLSRHTSAITASRHTTTPLPCGGTSRWGHCAARAEVDKRPPQRGEPPGRSLMCQGVPSWDASANGGVMSRPGTPPTTNRPRADRDRRPLTDIGDCSNTVSLRSPATRVSLPLQGRRARMIAEEAWVCTRWVSVISRSANPASAR